MVLSDSDILDFSKKLNDSRFFIRPEYKDFSSYPVIGYYINPMHQDIRNLGQGNYSNDVHGRISEPNIEYEFTFSVCEKRLDEFFLIFNKITRNGIDNFVYQTPKEYKSIEFTDDVIHSKSLVTHSYMNRNYIKIQYKFRGKVSSIIAYVQALKDTISYFGMIWGYTEDGEELCLLKYPIGSIVSTLNDKSIDFLVVDYRYEKSTNSKFTIYYEVYEMISTENLLTLQYGKMSVFLENQLSLSRTAQINSILN